MPWSVAVAKEEYKCEANRVCAHCDTSDWPAEASVVVGDPTALSAATSVVRVTFMAGCACMQVMHVNIRCVECYIECLNLRGGV